MAARASWTVRREGHLWPSFSHPHDADAFNYAHYKPVHVELAMEDYRAAMTANLCPLANHASRVLGGVGPVHPLLLPHDEVKDAFYAFSHDGNTLSQMAELTSALWVLGLDAASVLPFDDPAALPGWHRGRPPIFTLDEFRRLVAETRRLQSYGLVHHAAAYRAQRPRTAYGPEWVRWHPSMATEATTRRIATPAKKTRPASSKSVSPAGSGKVSLPVKHVRIGTGAR